MSAKKKAAKKAEREDLRLPATEEVDALFPGHGEETVNDIAKMFEARTKLDPQAKVWREIAVMFAPIIEGAASDELKAVAGKYMIHMMESGSVILAEKIFADIVGMMKERARLKATDEKPHRHARAMAAYTKFRELYGEEPSKPVLKFFILNNTDKLGTDWPPEEDGKGWSRVWIKAGLSHLSDR